MRFKGKAVAITFDGPVQSLYSTLAVRLEFADAVSDQNTVDVIGLFQQQAWVREEHKKPSKESKEQRLARPRESQRWAAAMADVKPPAASRCIYVADRESDIWEVFGRCVDAGVSFVTTPRVESYGKVAVFLDLEGNRWDLLG